MKRTALKRKAPLKRTGSLRPNSYAEAVARMRSKGSKTRPEKKPRVVILSSTPTRAAQLREYSKERLIFLDSCVCARCAEKPATEVHHKRGRIGRLLNDQRFWIGVCGPCHTMIHGNPNQAREDGLLAKASEWNVFPLHYEG